MDNPRLSARGAANEDENRKRRVIRSVKFFVFIAAMVVIIFVLYLSNYSLEIKLVAYALSMATVAFLKRVLDDAKRM